LLFASAVMAGMQELLEVRAADDQQDFGARIRKAVDTILPALSITRQPPASSLSTATAAESQPQQQRQQQQPSHEKL
jgi:hypothetical protein